MKEHADDFKNLNAELIFVYREEREGTDGLKKIKDKYNPPFILSLDFEKKSSGAYSPKPSAFDNYVIDKKGIVRGIIKGTKTDRAKAEELIELLKEIEAD